MQSRIRNSSTEHRMLKRATTKYTRISSRLIIINGNDSRFSRYSRSCPATPVRIWSIHINTALVISPPAWLHASARTSSTSSKSSPSDRKPRKQTAGTWKSRKNHVFRKGKRSESRWLRVPAIGWFLGGVTSQHTPSSSHSPQIYHPSYTIPSYF